MSPEELQGQERAEAFHAGMEAGMKAGSDIMRAEVMKRLEALAGETALYRGVITALRDDLSRLDPFKMYDPNH